MTTAGRGPAAALEGAAVETRDGMIFTVKGVIHPPGGVIAYLRYVPDPTGDRERGGRRYRRVYAAGEREATLRAHGLTYSALDPALGVPVETVPWSEVEVVHDPRERLARLRITGADDPLTASAVRLCDLLAGAAGVPPAALGLTGSLLFGLQLASSDVDLVVYGEREGRAVHGALTRLVDDGASGLERPGAADLAAIHAQHRADTPLAAADFARHQAAKVNEGGFRGRPYFVRFVKLPEEVHERWGEPRYESLGHALVQARVADAADAIYTPCRYRLAEPRTVEGRPCDDLEEIVSFRGRFADQARTGERVRARGSLERVIRGGRPASTRLVVGGPGDYLVSLPAG